MCNGIQTKSALPAKPSNRLAFGNSRQPLHTRAGLFSTNMCATKERKTLKQRFWDKINMDGPIQPHVPNLGKCWSWTGRRGGGMGYGLGRYEMKEQPAHRISWQIHFGPIPSGMMVCHHCDNPGCVNPNHLFIGHHADNMRDRRKKNRYDTLEKGSLRYNAKLDEGKVLRIDRMLSGGVPVLKIAKMFSVSRMVIYMIKYRLRWKHVFSEQHYKRK